MAAPALPTQLTLGGLTFEFSRGGVDVWANLPQRNQLDSNSFFSVQQPSTPNKYRLNSGSFNGRAYTFPNVYQTFETSRNIPSLKGRVIAQGELEGGLLGALIIKVTDRENEFSITLNPKPVPASAPARSKPAAATHSRISDSIAAASPSARPPVAISPAPADQLSYLGFDSMSNSGHHRYHGLSDLSQQ